MLLISIHIIVTPFITLFRMYLRVLYLFLKRFALSNYLMRIISLEIKYVFTIS